MADPVSRLGEIKARHRDAELLRGRMGRADVGWLLEHIEQLQDEIDRRNTPWQTSDLWGRMSAADPEIREALIQAWNERDRLGAQRQSVLDLCDRNASEVYPAGIFDPFIQLLRIALGADDDR
jgi:hypothetical protein